MFNIRRLPLFAGVVGVILALGVGAAIAASSDIGDQAQPLAGGAAFVLGLGQQQPGTDALFSINAKETTNPSTGRTKPSGEMTWEETNPATLLDAKVTCVQVNGEDALVTGVLRIPSSRAGEHVVAEAVDNDTSGATDQLRFSFQSNGGAVKTAVPGCWQPVAGGPVDIAAGFLEVEPGIQGI